MLLDNLPNNDQFYSLFITLASKMKVKRLNKQFLSYFKLQLEDSTNSFASIKIISFVHDVVGNNQLFCFLYLLRYCPLLYSIDLSKIENIFIHDTFINYKFKNVKLIDCFDNIINDYTLTKNTYEYIHPTGNQIIQLICCIITMHPSLNYINLKCHDIGYEAFKLLEYTISIRPIHLELNIIAGLKLNMPSKDTEFINHIHSIKYIDFTELNQASYKDRKVTEDRIHLRLLIISYIYNIEQILTCKEIDKSLCYSNKITISEAIRLSNCTLLHNTSDMNSLSSCNGDGRHLFIIESGSIHFKCGASEMVLTRGTYWGLPLLTKLENEIPEWTTYHMGQLSLHTEGIVYIIPLIYIQSWINFVFQQIKKYYSFIIKVPIFQSLPLFIIQQVTHGISVITKANTITKANSFQGLYIVTKGNIIHKYNHGNIIKEYSIYDYFGEEMLFDKTNENQSNFIFNESTTEVLKIDKEYFNLYVFDFLYNILKHS